MGEVPRNMHRKLPNHVPSEKNNSNNEIIKDEKTPFNKDVDGFSARHEDEEREEADTFPQGDPDSFQPHVPQHDEAEATQQTFGMLLGADVAVSLGGGTSDDPHTPLGLIDVARDKILHYFVFSDFEEGGPQNFQLNNW